MNFNQHKESHKIDFYNRIEQLPYFGMEVLEFVKIAAKDGWEYSIRIEETGQLYLSPRVAADSYGSACIRTLEVKPWDEIWARCRNNKIVHFGYS